MKNFYHIMFLLFLALGYTNQCFSQTSDQYGKLPDEEAIQFSYKHLQQPLYRVEGLVYQQDDLGDYWQVDTTKVMVRVNGNIIPEDVDWKVDETGYAEVPVPEGIQIEDFAMSLWELPWVVKACYITCAKYAGGNLTGIQNVPNTQKGKKLGMGCYDLTGRPISTPSKGLYIRNGKKVMFK